MGQGHADGVEANGIVNHRVGWSLGWIASSAAGGLKPPNAEDVYAHIGVKSGGVALDGEGKYGPNVPDPKKPWAEKAITLDAFAYNGMNVLDNGTGTIAGAATPSPIGQRDHADAAGTTLRAQWDSLVLDSGLQFELHQRQYPGSAATASTSWEAPQHMWRQPPRLSCEAKRAPGRQTISDCRFQIADGGTGCRRRRRRDRRAGPRGRPAQDGREDAEPGSVYGEPDG